MSWREHHRREQHRLRAFGAMTGHEPVGPRVHDESGQGDERPLPQDLRLTPWREDGFAGVTRFAFHHTRRGRVHAECREQGIHL